MIKAKIKEELKEIIGNLDRTIVKSPEGFLVKDTEDYNLGWADAMRFAVKEVNHLQERA